MQNKQPPKTHPLKFAYVVIHLLDAEAPLPSHYKVFQIYEDLFRVRAVRVVGGAEVEGPNTWIPKAAIRTMVEVTPGVAAYKE